MFHNQALLSTLLAATLSGASAALDWTFSVSRFWAQTRRYGATNCSILGSMLTMLWNNPVMGDDNQNPVRIMKSIPIPTDIHRSFERRFGLKLVTGYGATEAGTVLTTGPDDEARPGYAGRAVPWMDVRVVDENDDQVNDGEIGELVCRPLEPSIVSEGYISDSEATLRTRKNLWIHTGDLASRTPDGWFRFVDRKADYIRRRGENISSFEVEEAIRAGAGVADVAVHRVPSELTEDEIKAWIVPVKGASVSPVEVIRHCEAHLPYFAIPRYIQFVDDLPRSPVGKVLKSELMELTNSGAWDREEAGIAISRPDVVSRAPRADVVGLSESDARDTEAAR